MANTLSISIKQNSQNIANNTSNITVSVIMSWTSLSYNQNQKDGSLTIDGTAYAFKNSFNDSKTSSGSKTLFTKTLDIAHAADGSKTVSCSASYVTGVSSGTITATASKALTTIPRATQPTVSASSVAMGSAVTISTPRASGSFTHTLTYKFGNASGTIATGVGTSYAWTVPLNLANQIPSSTSGTCTITCNTYNGSSLIGTKTVTLTLTVPSSVVPSISAVATSDPTGMLGTYGAYVQGKSTCKITVTASGSYGSSISSYSIVANGVTYTTNGSTTGKLNTTGTNSISVTVTDSRGRTAKSSTSISVIGYANPTISTLSAYRCLSDGTADEDGAYMKVTLGASITALNNHNGKTIKLYYKKHTDASYTLSETYSAYSVATNKIIAADINSSYDVYATAQDNFATSSKTIQVGSAFTLMDFRSTGKGLAIGKVAEKDGLEIAFPTSFVYSKHSTSISNNELILSAVENAGVPTIGVATPTQDIALHIGSGGTNRGIYDRKIGTWIIYEDAGNNVKIPRYNWTLVKSFTSPGSSITIPSIAGYTDIRLMMAGRNSGGTDFCAFVDVPRADIDSFKRYYECNIYHDGQYYINSWFFFHSHTLVSVSISRIGGFSSSNFAIYAR